MPAQVPVPIMGANEWFGIGFEGPAAQQYLLLRYGVGEEPSIYYRPASNTLRATPVTEALQGPPGSFSRFKYDSVMPRHLRLPSDRSGQVVLELDYDDVGWLLTNLIVQPSAATVPSSGTPPGGTHIWALPGAGPVPPPALPSPNVPPYPGPVPSSPPCSMTCVRNHGLTGRDYKIGGCYINQAVFRGQAGSLVTVTLDIVGATGGEPYTPISVAYENASVPSFSVAPFIEFFHSDIRVSTDLNPANLVGYANSGGDVSEWTLTYNNNYDISPSAGGGTLGIRAPTWQTAPQITLEYTHRWTSAKEFNSMHPATEDLRYKYIRLVMAHPTAVAGQDGVSTTPISLVFDIPAALFLGDPPVYDGGTGFVTQNVRIEASGGGTSNSNIFVATLTNDTTVPASIPNQSVQGYQIGPAGTP